jgi:hypothetical protein
MTTPPFKDRQSFVSKSVMNPPPSDNRTCSTNISGDNDDNDDDPDAELVQNNQVKKGSAITFSLQGWFQKFQSFQVKYKKLSFVLMILCFLIAFYKKTRNVLLRRLLGSVICIQSNQCKQHQISLVHQVAPVAAIKSDCSTHNPNLSYSLVPLVLGVVGSGIIYSWRRFMSLDTNQPLPKPTTHNHPPSDHTPRNA